MNPPEEPSLTELLERAKRHPEAARLCESVAGNPYADARLRTAVGDGVDYTIAYDTTMFVQASIAEVIETLVIAVILVVFRGARFRFGWLFCHRMDDDIRLNAPAADRLPIG